MANMAGNCHVCQWYGISGTFLTTHGVFQYLLHRRPCMHDVCVMNHKL